MVSWKVLLTRCTTKTSSWDISRRINSSSSGTRKTLFASVVMLVEVVGAEASSSGVA